ncbi:MFS transporter [Paenibacillus hamazuiensis]|uniref:MFS transporter n=1 Tax=Paenibacillus hamazuiensis TaxID=2936508 RepID=UPI00200F7A60|nr:MFS transporter [Paenibacillus hamazuiensis]
MDESIPRNNGEKLIRVLAFTLAVSLMSATMFNIVLTEIRSEFHLSFAQVSWVSTIYLLIYAIGTVMYGKLADSFKMKNLVTFGLIFFAAGSMIGLIAQAYWMVLAGRILQAAGAAVIPAIASIIPVRYFPAESRGRAIGISMTGLSIGNVLGPVVASGVVSILDWRWLFCMPLFTLFTLPLYRKYLGDHVPSPGKIDWWGGGLLAGAVALLLLAISKGMWTLFAGCAILFILFAARVRRADNPFIPPGLFGNKGYTIGLTIVFLMVGTYYSIPFLSPQLLSQVNALDPGLVGFVMVPAAFVAALLGKKAGKWADAKGNPFLVYAAFPLLFGCFFLLSTFAGGSPWLVMIFLIIGVVGQTFMYIALSNTISQTLPKEQVGIGMGLLSMLNFLAGAVSASVCGKIIDLDAAARWNPFNPSPEAAVFSNLYLVISAIQVVVVWLYYSRFGRGRRRGQLSP